MVEKKIDSNPDIYVAGTVHDGISYKATLWKNEIATTLSVSGVVSPLSKNHSSFANAVFVIEKDVYAVGNVQSDSNNTIATLWKNGIATALTNSTNTANANAIFVVGNDVYIVGTEMEATNKYVAKLWKNDEIVTLPNSSVAKSVFVLEGNVYVAGFLSENNRKKAKLWKNNKEVLLLETDDTVANSVYVYENDVYVIGVRHNNINTAILWKNGISLPLIVGTNTANANALFVLNKNVYVVGKETDLKNNYRAKLWKNGEVLMLFEGNDAQSIYVFKDDVYVAGCEITLNGTFSMATLWKNNNKVTLSKNRSYAYDVFVK